MNQEDVNVLPNKGFQSVFNSVNGLFANPSIILISVIILILYLVLFGVLGVSSPQTNQPASSGLNVIEIIMWGLLIFLVLINGLQYFYGLDAKTSLHNLFKGRPTVDVKLSPESKLKLNKKNKTPPKNPDNKEVFHIKKNIFNYKQAKAICKAFDSELATYDQLRIAHNNGAEWCGYGWSDGQMALFPTQKKTWKTLQKIKGHENDCGRPGINGGFIKNPFAKFGVNCYGVKRDINDIEDELLKMKQKQPYPLTEEEKQLKKLTNYYKQNIDKILLNPFNQNKWSAI